MTNTEIERKYLITGNSFLTQAVAVHHISQGYLSVNPDCTIRVRRKDDKAYLTVKGRNPEGGISHFEWEKPITAQDAEALLSLCREGIILKERFLVPLGSLTIEVDVFHGANEGLVLAEIELPSEDYPLPPLPDFIGQEVTSDPRYYNSYLSTHPFTTW